MKNFLSFFLSFFLLTNPLLAQLEMNSSGEVGIGDSPVSGIDFLTPEAKITRLGINTNPTSSYELYVAGDCKLQGYYTIYSLILEYGGSSETLLRPSTNNKCLMGTSSYAYREMYAYDFQDLSDKRQKENIQNLSGALEKVLKLQGVSYDLKKEYAYDESLIKNPEELAFFETDRKNKIGFLAQDVNEVLPEVVSYDDSSDIYSMNYSKIVPVLVEAIKEQQAQIESLKNLLQTLVSPLPEFKSATADSESINSLDDGITELFQNEPNPFTEETTIRYQLAEEISSANIYIYDMTGKQLASHILGQEREGEIIISGGELNAGLYLYTMLADGQLIGTKQMLLTD